MVIRWTGAWHRSWAICLEETDDTFPAQENWGWHFSRPGELRVTLFPTRGIEGDTFPDQEELRVTLFPTRRKFEESCTMAFRWNEWHFSNPVGGNGPGLYRCIHDPFYLSNGSWRTDNTIKNQLAKWSWRIIRGFTKGFEDWAKEGRLYSLRRIESKQ